MTENPFIPPEPLRDQWQVESPYKVVSLEREDYMINRAAQWGADQELEACCEWLENQPQWMEDLRAARRPETLSLREQALRALEQIEAHTIAQMSAYGVYEYLQKSADTIRRALEESSDD